MKTRTFIALTACSGTLIANSTSDAAFLGIEAVNVSSWMSTTGPANFRNSYNAAGGPAEFAIYRLFAKFDNSGTANPNNRVNAITGQAGNPWSLTVQSGSVYNWTEYASSPLPTTLHNNLAPTSNNPSSFIQGWETWATIGTQNSPSAATFTPGAHVGQLNNFQRDFSANDAALYITPDDTQGNAIALSTTSAVGMGGTGYGVLLMQITATPGVNLTMNFNLNIGGTGSTQDIFGLFTIIPFPTPGTLPMLGLAALIGGRRRRT